MNSAEEQNNIRKARTGDSGAFSALVEHYAEELYRYLYRFTGNHADTDDLLQEVFLNAYRGLGKFRDKSNFRSWLYAIARNRFLNFNRRKKKEKSFADSKKLSENSASNTGETIEGELQKEIHKAIQELSQSHRQVVTLFIMEGFSHKEIAEITGCSEEAVRFRLFKARQKLKKLLKDYL